MESLIGVTFKLCFCAWLVEAVLSQSSVIPSQHEFCVADQVSLEEAGSRAHIKSQGYPHYVPDEGIRASDCSMTIKACEGCYMVFETDELILTQCNRPVPEQGTCIEGCDHLMLFEPDYPERTAEFILLRRGEHWTYTTVTRNVFLKFCRTTQQNADIAFSFYITVVEKTRTLTGSPGEGGSITSPFFPEKYNAHVGLDLYPYVLRNNDANGRINVTFTDWNLMPESYIQISFDAAKSHSISRNGGEQRPFIISTANRLYVDFYTGKEDPNYIPGLPYPGFRLEYHFLDEGTQPVVPDHSCGRYFKNTWGGHFEYKMSRSLCSAGDVVDCVWVFSKQNNQQSFPEVELVFTSLQLDDTDFMEIRSGTISTGRLVASTNLAATIAVDSVYRDSDGFYVHLTSRCQAHKHVEATFISVVLEQRQWECDDVTAGFWCENRRRCIHESLVCDGVDHCGNGRDEAECQDPVSCSREVSCRTGGEWYCVSEQCDGVQQCADATDETNCGPSHNNQSGESNSNLLTIIPAIVVPIVLGLCICAVLVFFMHKRRKRHLARRREAYAQQRAVQRSSFVATPPPSSHPGPFAIGGFMAYPEAPPSYEASQQHVNMAYMRSNSEEMLGKPPPYHHPEARRTPPRSSASSSQSNQNTPLANQSSASSPSAHDMPNADLSRSLTGAGALHSLSLTGIMPTLSPTSNRQSSVDVAKENALNLNIEAVRQDTDAKTPEKGRRTATRAKRRLDLPQHPSTSQSGSDVAQYGFENGAYSMNTTDDDKGTKESNV